MINTDFLSKINLEYFKKHYDRRGLKKEFKREGVTKFLELGCGQGRDTLYFARNGFSIYSLDYSNQELEAINNKAHELGLSHLHVTKFHDGRNPLPFDMILLTPATHICCSVWH